MYRTLIMAGALALLGTSSAFAADSCTAPDQPLRAVAATHTQPPYPEMSVMTGEQGTTTVRVAIGADGVPTKVDIVTSSGSLRLDAAAADHIRDTWRWNAPVKNCQPVAVETGVRITWDLRSASTNPFQPPRVNMDPRDYPPEAKQKREQGDVTLIVIVSPTGEVHPIVQHSSGFPDLDAKSVEIVSRWRWTPANLDGRAMLSGVYLVSSWKLDAPPK